jgi:hypothetical protein
MKLNRQHYNALQNVIRGSEDDDQIIKANEALDIIDQLTKKSDVEIAAKEQGLKRADIIDCWINTSGEMFHWTPKGFKIVGTLTSEHWEKLTEHVPEIYCRCPYPTRENVGKYNICGKCGNKLL